MTGAATQTTDATAAGAQMIVVMMTDVVPKVAGTNVVAMSVAEMTVEEMSAEVVEMSGVAMSAEETRVEETTGAAIEIAGRNSKAVVRGGELLKLAPRLCRGYLLQLLIPSSESLVGQSIRLMISLRRAKKLPQAEYMVERWPQHGGLLEGCA